MKVDNIFRACDRHSNDTVTRRKIVGEYEHIRKWMVEFLNKALKLLVNSIHLIKSTNLI